MDINNTPAGTFTCSINSFKCKYNANKAQNWFRQKKKKNQCPTKECNKICQKTAVIWWKSCWKKRVSYLSGRATDGGEVPPPHKPAVGSHNILVMPTLQQHTQMHRSTSFLDILRYAVSYDKGESRIPFSRLVQVCETLGLTPRAEGAYQSSHYERTEMIRGNRSMAGSDAHIQPFLLF